MDPAYGITLGKYSFKYATGLLQPSPHHQYNPVKQTLQYNAELIRQDKRG